MQMAGVVVDVVDVELIVGSRIEGRDGTEWRCNASASRGGQVLIEPNRIVVMEIVNVVCPGRQVSEQEKQETSYKNFRDRA
jgi:hypothetical protein